MTYLSGNSSITLEWATIAESDAGDYQCQAVFDSDMIKTEAVTIAVYGVYV